MNKLGKFLLIPLIVLFSVLGFFMAGKLLVQRNKMAADFDSAFQANQQKAEQLSKAQIAHDELLADISRQNLGWDALWNDQTVTMPPQPQNFQAFATNLGTIHGLVDADAVDDQGKSIKLPPHVFGFVQTGPDQTRYIGELAAENLQAQSSSLRPTWLTNPMEVGSWYQTQGKWRIRERIPSSYRAGVEGLYARLIHAYQNGQSLTRQITLQTELQQLATENLDVRKGELLGNPNIERTEDRPELAIGLVSAIEEVEELRNQLQKEVDDLRRIIKEESDFQNQTVEDLQQTVGVTKPAATQISQK